VTDYKKIPPRDDAPFYWITPVGSSGSQTSDQIVKALVSEAKIYAFSNWAVVRAHLKPQDQMCFYASQKGVVAHATIATSPEHKLDPRVPHPERYPWLFHLKNPVLYLNHPVVIDDALRARLDAFRGRDLSKGGAWLIQTTRQISKHDFDILTQNQIHALI